MKHLLRWISLCFLLTLILGCTDSIYPVNKEVLIHSPKLLSLLNENYSNVTIEQASDNKQYYYLKLPYDKQLNTQLRKIVRHHIRKEDKACFEFTHNSVGLHVTLLSNASKQQAYYLNKERHSKVKVQFEKFYTLAWVLPHSHTREIIYAVDVTIDSADYSKYFANGKYIDKGTPLHLTLALFKKDQNNQCVRRQ